MLSPRKCGRNGQPEGVIEKDGIHLSVTRGALASVAALEQSWSRVKSGQGAVRIRHNGDRQGTMATRVHSMQRAESVPMKSVNKQEGPKIAGCGNTVSETDVAVQHQRDRRMAANGLLAYP